jgi:hypothetical protein
MMVGIITINAGTQANPAPQSNLFFSASMDAKPRTSSLQNQIGREAQISHIKFHERRGAASLAPFETWGTPPF